MTPRPPVPGQRRRSGSAEGDLAVGTGRRRRIYEQMYTECPVLDRRITVSAPTQQGRDAVLADGKAVHQLFPNLVVVPIAVRGERLAPARLRLVSDDDFELSILNMYETDE